ncbi:MAG: hypothetical protein H7339_16730 [Arcicella sp.]|nr:hypothetical protein [Arcicella sp.]
MTALLIGITVALLQILAFEFLKKFDKNSIYALTLSGIGFLYVGYTWTDIPTVIITLIQAVIFVLIAYYGLVKNTYILATGYFLHGLWDIVYPFWGDTTLIPPHYDWFCMSLDFTVGTYLIFKVMKHNKKSLAIN